MSVWQRVSGIHNRLFTYTTWLENTGLFLARLYMAWVFFKSGLVKVQDWDSTLLLFEYEYVVPFLPFDVAAYLATFGELFFPLLLALGLFSRVSAFAISVINIVAVISLPEMPQAALNLHIIWGLLLGWLVLHGGGWLTGDKFLHLR